VFSVPYYEYTNVYFHRKLVALITDFGHELEVLTGIIRKMDRCETYIGILG